MNKLILLVEKDHNKLQMSLHKMVLAYYAEKYGVSREKILIKKGNGGKPYITIQGVRSTDFFNISHTSDIGVVVFSNREMGIDIEMIGNPDGRIVKRFFHKNEQQYLHDSVDETECRKRFYEIWTKKEAYLKWNGRGLAGGLTGLDVLAKRYAFRYIEIGGKEYALAVYGQCG